MRGVPVLRRPSSALSRRVLRVNGVEPKTSAEAAPLPPPQIAAGGEGVHRAGDLCARSRIEQNMNIFVVFSHRSGSFINCQISDEPFKGS